MQSSVAGREIPLFETSTSTEWTFFVFSSSMVIAKTTKNLLSMPVLSCTDIYSKSSPKQQKPSVTQAELLQQDETTLPDSEPDWLAIAPDTSR